ncbi:MAG: hypothetical protein OJF60_002451 [Burkholderiaceae bacterium]|jgi:hypothetical protein|nr:MAG: hypothetical protein OJF60_002451 [Burkholderiaceae bacterium]
MLGKEEPNRCGMGRFDAAPLRACAGGCGKHTEIRPRPRRNTVAAAH